ncbi:MAG: penicillin-binding protein [Parabacteroides sp.]|nr:penicillin-binding protein [Parabacteroides sp.]
MKTLSYTLLVIFGLLSCQTNKFKVDHVSTIDSTLQAKASSILENKLSEINALSGQVIIMETQTGQIKALVGLERIDSAVYQPHQNTTIQQPTGLMQPVSLLVALETGKINLSDTVDVGNGIYKYKEDVIKDHNWHRGGYGEITLEQGIMVGSNIATVKTVEKVFGNNPQSYFDALTKASYGEPKVISGMDDLRPITFDKSNLAYSAIGYNQFITPIQTLAFYNAIANNGKMVQPQLHKDSVQIINPQIARTETIKNIQQALIKKFTEGLGKPANSDKTTVAGETGTICLNDSLYAAECCGYFPTNNPKYTILITINKIGLPASGGLMAGDVFKKIADKIYQ